MRSQIRISRDGKIYKAYAKGMYTNESDVQVCQMCQKPTTLVDVDQIANYGIEMPQLNLCLCKECSAIYKMTRDTNKEAFCKRIRTSIISKDVGHDEEKYEIEFNQDKSIYFTQTHIAEIQEIFRLLEEYGIPSDDKKNFDEDTASGPLLHPIKEKDKQHSLAERFRMALQSKAILNTDTDTGTEIKGKNETNAAKKIKPGDFITNKKLNDGELYDNTVQPDRFPLHKLFVGTKEGDVVTFRGKQYEITVIH